MEKTLWLLYLADVIESIGVIATISLITGFVVTGFTCIAGMADSKTSPILFKYLRWLAIPIVLGAVLPSSKTIKIMAIASATESAASTALGKKALEALNKMLDDVIASKK